MKKITASAIALSLSACAAAPAVQFPAVGRAGLPKGATFGADGFASIAKAPPAPYPADPPLSPETLDTLARRTSLGTPAEQAAAWAEANGPEDFQREVQRLMQLLPDSEKGNFVQLRLARDETSTRDPQPLLGAEVLFKRNASATLAKYTRDPRFFAKQGGLAEAEMERLRTLWTSRLKPLWAGWGMSSNPSLGRLEIDLGITETAFSERAREKGWTWGDEVAFTFSKPQPPAFAEGALASLVRTFAREATNPLIRMTALGSGRIVLDDGCFRLEGQPRSNVMFAYDTQLARDSEGYLVVARPGATEGGYRIGEPGNWGAPNFVAEKWPDVIALRKACGNGPILNVADPSSERIFALPFADWVLDYTQVNWLTYDEAWDRIMACYVREERKGKRGLELRGSCVTQFNRKGVEGDPPMPD